MESGDQAGGRPLWKRATLLDRSIKCGVNNLKGGGFTNTYSTSFTIDRKESSSQYIQMSTDTMMKAGRKIKTLIDCRYSQSKSVFISS